MLKKARSLFTALPPATALLSSRGGRSWPAPRKQAPFRNAFSSLPGKGSSGHSPTVTHRRAQRQQGSIRKCIILSHVTCAPSSRSNGGVANDGGDKRINRSDSSISACPDERKQYMRPLTHARAHFPALIFLARCDQQAVGALFSSFIERVRAQVCWARGACVCVCVCVHSFFLRSMLAFHHQA